MTFLSFLFLVFNLFLVKYTAEMGYDDDSVE